jgi:hypothetical protein
MFETIIEKHKELIDTALMKYDSQNDFVKYFNRIPKSRYYTFKYCIDEFINNNFKTVVELGTSRSYVDGRYEGCNNNNPIYWQPNNPEVWDWAAGSFTRTFADSFKHIDNIEFHTVDLAANHIYRCKVMNETDFPFINFHISTSEDFLQNYNKKIDLLYLDTGDMTPIQHTAELHLREAKIIIERDLINDNGIILIDDIRSVVPYKYGESIDLGKGYLSIPYFLNNGFELVMDEYQTILRKKI